MPPRAVSISDDFASVLPPRRPRARLGLLGGIARPRATRSCAPATALGAMTFTGIFVPGLNRATWLANSVLPGRDVLHDAGTEGRGRGDEVPAVLLRRHSRAGSRSIADRRRPVHGDAARCATGHCSFGPVVDFLADLWPSIPVRVAHINPRLPRVAGPLRHPLRRAHGLFRSRTGAPRRRGPPDDALSRAIGEAVARFVPDGATIQTGLGKIPTAALRALKGRRGLKIHSGLIPEAVVDLEDAGALAPGVSVTGGVAIGSRRLYERVGGAAYRFHPVSHTHSPRVAGGDRQFRHAQFRDGSRSLRPGLCGAWPLRPRCPAPAARRISRAAPARRRLANRRARRLGTRKAA